MYIIFSFIFFWGGGFHSLYIELPKSYTRHLSTWFIRSWYSNSRLLSGLNDSIFSTKVSPVDHLSPFHSYKHVQKLKRIFPNGIMVRKKELIYRYINNWTHLKQNHYYKNNDKFSLSETRDMYNIWN